jgi:hypothetical protein
MIDIAVRDVAIRGLVPPTASAHTLRQGPNECDNWPAVRQPVVYSPEQ